MLNKEQFTKKVKEEKDTEYLHALLYMASGYSQEWIVDVLTKEIQSRC